MGWIRDMTFVIVLLVVNLVIWSSGYEIAKKTWDIVAVIDFYFVIILYAVKSGSRPVWLICSKGYSHELPGMHETDWNVYSRSTNARKNNANNIRRSNVHKPNLTKLCILFIVDSRTIDPRHANHNLSPTILHRRPLGTQPSSTKRPATR